MGENMLLSIENHKLCSTISHKNPISPRSAKAGENEEIYHWMSSCKEPLVLGIRTPVSALVSVLLWIQEPLMIPWLQLYMDPEMIEHDGHIHDYFIANENILLHIAYTAKLESKNVPELTQVLNIENVSLSVKNRPSKKVALEQEVHQICATIKKNNRTEPISLGRAQAIQTTLLKNQNTRTYGWLAKQQEKEKSSPREQKEKTAATTVLPLSFISPRVVISEVDHDGFSNSERILPIALREEESPVISLQFFNMKDKPPRFFEWSIRWGALVDNTTPPPSPFMQKLHALKPKRKSVANRKRYAYKEEITNLVHATIIYYFDSDRRICLEEIYLEAKEYKKSLQAMNDCIIPKTI